MNLKKNIESVKKVDKTFYDKLVESSNVRLINEYFEKYLNDTSVVDDDEKFARVSYYLEITNQEEDVFDFYVENADEYDLLTMYFKDVNKVKLLSVDEEYLCFKKIRDLQKIIQTNSVSLEKINNDLELFGYKTSNFVDNTLKNLEEKLNYVSKKINDV